VNYENDDIYIGSTTEPTLARRLAEHVSNYKSYLDGKRNYVTSYKVIASGSYDIQLVEAYPCNNKMELHAREGHWIKQMECVNKNVAGRTKKEYREDNKDIIRENKRKYNEENRDKIKEYRKANKEANAKYQKEYREENRDKIKEYREQNKDVTYEKKNKKHTCLCGGKYTHCHESLHMRTKKHINYINSIEYLEDIHEYVQSIVKKFPTTI
jgi:hypothetical protein